MSDKKTEDSGKQGPCGSCGDEGVMLTEERNAPPRCAGCGKPLSQHSKK